MDGVLDVTGALDVVSVLVQLVNSIINLQNSVECIEHATLDIAAFCSQLKWVSSILKRIRTEMTTISSEARCLTLFECIFAIEDLQTAIEDLSPGFISNRIVIRGWTALRSLMKKEKIKVVLKDTLLAAQITLTVAQQEAMRYVLILFFPKVLGYCEFDASHSTGRLR
ncbi:hypothetical protein MMC11_002789 [Xylographa trunciseda]|nr:hypothetical protein [Xylographa trunciseda]